MGGRVSTSGYLDTDGSLQVHEGGGSIRSVAAVDGVVCVCGIDGRWAYWLMTGEVT